MEGKDTKPMGFAQDTPQDLTQEMASYIAIVIGAVAGQNGFALDEKGVKSVFDSYDENRSFAHPFAHESGDDAMRAFRSGIVRGWMQTLSHSAQDREDARVMISLNCSKEAMAVMSRIAGHCASGGRVVLMRDEHYGGSFDQRARMVAHSMLSALGKLFEVDSVTPSSGEGVHALVVKAVKQDTGENMAMLFESATKLRAILAEQKGEAPAEPQPGAVKEADAEVANLIQRFRGSRVEPDGEK